MSGKDLTEALRALTEQGKPEDIGPAAMKTRGAAGISRASALLGGDNNSTSAIASPLTETGYLMRTFYAERSIRSSDGLWAMKIKPVKSIQFTDARQDPVQINFADRP